MRSITRTRQFGFELLEPRRLLSFYAAASYGVGEADYVTGDFNGDSRLDIAATTHANTNMRVFLGSGDGTFQDPGGPLPTSGVVGAMVAGDFNEDGKLDIVTTIPHTSGPPYGYDIVLLPGNGNGTFGSPYTVMAHVGAGGFLDSMAAGDMNGDGHADLVIDSYGNISEIETWSALDILLGGGDGTFASASHTSLQDATFCALGDMNRDGRLDVVTGSHRSVLLGVLPGNGDGTLGSATFYGQYASVLTVGDVNADGKPDVATPNFVMLGNSDGSLQAPRYLPVGSLEGSVAVADINLDGIVDLVVGDSGYFDEESGSIRDSDVKAFLGNGDGSFRTAQIYPTSYWTKVVAAADLNSDGFGDLIATVTAGEVSVLINDGNWSVKTWIGPASGGNWFTAANWSPSGAPTASDHVVISAASVNLTASAAIAGLTLTGGAKLDLRDNNLVINYTGVSPIGSWNGAAYTGVTGMIQSGRNGGAWNGSGIVTSMAAAIGPSSRTTLGITQTASSVIVSYTFAGDANLSGGIDADDFFAIDSGYASQAGGYANGDFDYNGRTDADDYFIIDSNYNKAQTPLGSGSTSELPAPALFASGDDDSAYGDLMKDDLL